MLRFLSDFHLDQNRSQNISAWSLVTLILWIPTEDQDAKWLLESSLRPKKDIYSQIVGPLLVWLGSSPLCLISCQEGSIRYFKSLCLSWSEDFEREDSRSQSILWEKSGIVHEKSFHYPSVQFPHKFSRAVLNLSPHPSPLQTADLSW